MTTVKRLLIGIQRWVKSLFLVVENPVVDPCVTSPAAEPAFNPVALQGTRWATIRDRSIDEWVEVDRNKIGRVTLCALYCWRTSYPMTLTDRHIDTLLTMEQALEVMNGIPIIGKPHTPIGDLIEAVKTKEVQ